MDHTGAMSRAETPEPVVVRPVYGLIRQVNRKSGEQGQGIPVHAGQMTMGRYVLSLWPWSPDLWCAAEVLQMQRR